MKWILHDSYWQVNSELNLLEMKFKSYVTFIEKLYFLAHTKKYIKYNFKANLQAVT